MWLSKSGEVTHDKSTHQPLTTSVEECSKSPINHFPLTAYWPQQSIRPQSQPQGGPGNEDRYEWSNPMNKQVAI